MRITAVIEIPKGDDRRRHLNKYDKTTFIDLGPMRDHIAVNDGRAPEHYGYLPGTHNPSDEDEVDVIVFSDTSTTVGEKVEVEPLAILRRADGDEKVLAAAPGAYGRWEDIEEARRDLVLRFFGSHHRILSVGDRAEAESYIKAATVQE